MGWGMVHSVWGLLHLMNRILHGKFDFRLEKDEGLFSKGPNLMREAQSLWEKHRQPTDANPRWPTAGRPWNKCLIFFEKLRQHFFRREIIPAGMINNLDFWLELAVMLGTIISTCLKRFGVITRIVPTNHYFSTSSVITIWFLLGWNWKCHCQVMFCLRDIWIGSSFTFDSENSRLWG